MTPILIYAALIVAVVTLVSYLSYRRGFYKRMRAWSVPEHEIDAAWKRQLWGEK